MTPYRFDSPTPPKSAASELCAVSESFAAIRVVQAKRQAWIEHDASDGEFPIRVIFPRCLAAASSPEQPHFFSPHLMHRLLRPVSRALRAQGATSCSRHISLALPAQTRSFSATGTTRKNKKMTDVDGMFFGAEEVEANEVVAEKPAATPVTGTWGCLVAFQRAHGWQMSSTNPQNLRRWRQKVRNSTCMKLDPLISVQPRPLKWIQTSTRIQIHLAF